MQDTENTDSLNLPTSDAGSATTATVTEVEPNFFVKDDPVSGYIIEYRKDICIGAGSCAAIAQNTFIMNAENKAELLATTGDDADLILAAAQSCPVFAIVIKDRVTGEQIFPVLD